jgi:endonuclease G
MSEYINENNIKQRPGFRIDSRLNRKFATSTRDYTNSGYDRGHILPDASTDHHWGILEQSYLMSNIVPQTRMANRKNIFTIEKEERELTERDGMLMVTTYIFFGDNVKKLKNGQSVPIYFGKKLMNIRGEKCYKITNELLSQTTLIKCSTLTDEFENINSIRVR